MTDRKDKKTKKDKEMNPQDPESENGAVQEEVADQDEVTVLKRQLDEALDQSAEYKDGWQRARAEFDN